MYLMYVLYMYICNQCVYMYNIYVLMYVCMYVLMYVHMYMYDTLLYFYTPEPGILLMTLSLKQHPQLSAMLLEFICKVYTYNICIHTYMYMYV